MRRAPAADLPRVELVYDTGCPNVDLARERLREAMRGAGLEARWLELVIGRDALPDYARGYGSPTVLVDGRDVTGAEPTETDACCRVYAASGPGRGAPPTDVIARALRAADRG